MWHAHTVEYHLASKKEDIQPSAKTWMNLGHAYAQRNKPDDGQIGGQGDFTNMWNLK